MAQKVSDERLTTYLKTQKLVHIWIQDVLHIPLEANLLEALKTGVIICYLMNRIVEGSIPRIQEGTTQSFKLRENVNFFLLFVEEYGVPRYKLFQLNDLMEGKSIVAVVECLAELARIAASRGFTPKMKTVEEYTGPAPSITPQEGKAYKEQISRLKDKPKSAVTRHKSASIMKFQIQLGNKNREIDWSVVEKKLGKFQALVRGFLQRKRYKKMVRDQAYRDHVAQEILKTEQVYVSSLQTCIKVYYTPLEEEANKGKLLTKEDLKIIFSDIQVIEGLNKRLFAELQTAISEWSIRTRISHIFKEFVQFLKVYITYLQNYNASLAKINNLNKNEKFAKMLLELKKDPACHQLDLPSFLIMPVQRIPRYSMLLKDMAKHTWPEHPDYVGLNEAQEQVEKIAALLNQKKKEAEYSTKLLEICSSIVKAPINLMEAQRRFVREIVMQDHKTVVYLFTDMILTGQLKKGLKAKQVKYVDSFLLLETEVVDVPDDKTSQNNIEFKRTSQKKSSRISFPTLIEKQSWLMDIQHQQTNLQEAKNNKDKEINMMGLKAQGTAEEILSQRKKQSRLSMPTNLSQDNVKQLHQQKERLEIQIKELKKKGDLNEDLKEMLKTLEQDLQQLNSQLEALGVPLSPLMGHHSLVPKGFGTIRASKSKNSPASQLCTENSSPVLMPPRRLSIDSSSSLPTRPTSADLNGSNSEPLSPLIVPRPEDGNANSSSSSSSSPAPAGEMTLEEIRSQRGNLDTSKLESYLINDEFVKFFKMSKEEFSKLPKWRQEREKKLHGLY